MRLSAPPYSSPLPLLAHSSPSDIGQAIARADGDRALYTVLQSASPTASVADGRASLNLSQYGIHYYNQLVHEVMNNVSERMGGEGPGGSLVDQFSVIATSAYASVAKVPADAVPQYIKEEAEHAVGKKVVVGARNVLVGAVEEAAQGA